MYKITGSGGTFLSKNTQKKYKKQKSETSRNEFIYYKCEP